MAEATKTSAGKMPQLPDGPYLIGTETSGDTHALARDEVLRAVDKHGGVQGTEVRTACGRAAALLAPRWGAFEHGNRYLEDTCPWCRWTVAIAKNAIQAELDALAPDPDELPVFARVVGEPMMVVRICEAIIATTSGPDGREDGYDLDHPHVINLLAHATAHAPMLLLPEGCSEGDCDHQPEEEWSNPNWRCPYPEAAVGCGACSAQAGSYAGSWEGQFCLECTVYSPCDVLRAFAKHFGLALDRAGGMVLV
jgi:hypothetical protein